MNAEELYENHAKIVYGFLLKKCHDPHLAEDLMQDTFVIAIQKLHTFDGTCKVSTWLCAIAHHLLLSYYRKKKALQLEEDIEIVDEKIDWDSVSVMKYVHRLPEPYRETVYLRLAANLSFYQIGEIMGKSEVWGRVTFYRGKAKIKEMMENETAM